MRVKTLPHEIFGGRAKEMAPPHPLPQTKEMPELFPAPAAAAPHGEQPYPLHCAVLAGAEGLGKTRLAQELAHEATQQDWQVIWAGVAPYGEEEPYHLWTDVLRSARAQRLFLLPELTGRPHVLQPLSTLLPELHGFLPETPSQAEAVTSTTRLWEAIRTLLCLCARMPLLIVLDDLHRAAMSSCALLAFLLRQFPNVPLFFLCTCRTDVLPATHPLRGLLADLQRDQDLALLALTPLSEAAIGQMAAHLPEQEAQRISQSVAGNPFFATE